MKKVAISYKGKHFIIQDEDSIEGEYDIIDPYVDVEAVISKSLVSHVLDCIYYGIPAYIGKDEELKKRIDEIYKKYNEIEK